ncbi:bifunctional adenosylcobinamide kinase/adenosylcobinamide-phosphate guanylyltransferase [Neobacillus sp. OS1-2]|uniref:bifunctional adenosylcobinamide kinase/adenosylcobinamide-phosphate guanylyltransferase n=1 Tax=Neobacillus sp. OS1-2 TaxID=3070680 RepID=UPI0027E15B80|nr:bifunctional adenosylcobinamide kinase/adenosylcobinamide-phosphate guanylyltransferase [Neobacillus sp. OS1-2]WML39308.1 bifunctional adenosylcobinamide kinase/adenosylcobinamide-phosphate guanylyltransferase [Neobacillus sp. OS1-2]
MAQSSLIFITGGVRSGKSKMAEKLAIEMAGKNGGRLTYLATGVPSDQEMQQRIDRHKGDRSAGDYCWQTIEQPVQIGTLSDSVVESDIILVDCVTTLLNNELFSTQRRWDESFFTSVKDSIITGILSLKRRAGAIIVVSNEVLNEPLIGTDLVFLYGRLLGQIHQTLVNEADRALLVETGIPIVMKEVGR